MSFIHIRHATPIDAPLLNSVRILSELEHDVKVPPEAIAQLNFIKPNKPLPHYKNFIQNTTLVAEAKGTENIIHPLITENDLHIVGFTHFGLKKGNPNILGVGSFYGRTVKGAKIGSHLMQQIIFYAQKHNINSIELTSSKFANLWYQALGFKYIHSKELHILSAHQFNQTLSDITQRLEQPKLKMHSLAVGGLV